MSEPYRLRDLIEGERVEMRFGSEAEYHPWIVGKLKPNPPGAGRWFFRAQDGAPAKVFACHPIAVHIRRSNGEEFLIHEPFDTHAADEGDAQRRHERDDYRRSRD